MRIDSQLAFVPIGAPLSLVAAAGVDVPSTNIIDLLGAGGPGVAPPSIIGNVALFGTDFGIGAIKAQLEVVVGTAFTTGTSATLNVAFQLAPDTASTYQPGTWQTVAETGELTAAQLIANRHIARFDWPPAFPASLRPRYARLLFQVPAATLFTAGTIQNALVVAARDDISMIQAANNFVVA